MKHPTSFRLSTSTITLLKQLADKENRSITNMVETLILNKSKEDEKVARYRRVLIKMYEERWGHAPCQPEKIDPGSSVGLSPASMETLRILSED